jgi:MFS-type transporter involved in bile tolerance (Atg22 family)
MKILSMPTVVWIGGIFSLSLFGRELLELLIVAIGRVGVGLGIFGIVGALIWCVVPFPKKETKGSPLLLYCVVLILIVASLFLLDIPEERVHVIEFAGLSFLLGRDFIRAEHPHPFLMAALISLLLGFADEGLQALLPRRVGELRDAGINAISVFFGLGFLWMFPQSRARGHLNASE